jgi:glycosyltransferase involved in cell wall biosynthesis
MRMAARGVLRTRAVMQRRRAGAADAFVAPSAVFAHDIERDYRIDPRRVHVVPNPIDLERFAPSLAVDASPARLELVYVSRIALRKGVELVVALSHRLSDLAGSVRIRVVGDKAMFSDYRPLLAGLNSAVATYEGGHSSLQLAELYRNASALLQPSHYEPFALTVGEALASGLPVVASDQVGATESVDRRVCRVFRSGDLDAFEATVRGLIDDLSAGERQAYCELARSEAERLFAPDVVAGQLVAVFESVRLSV